jgi:acyl-CoA thioesterase-1
MKKITRNQIGLFLLLSLVVISAASWWFARPAVAPQTDDVAATGETPVATSPDYTIIAVGDSLTAGYGLPAAEAYPAELESRLRAAGISVRIINAGVSGETTRGARERAEFIRRQNPDLVLLGSGGNDALRFIPITETEDNLRSILTTLTSGDTPPTVIVLTMQAPLNAGQEYKARFDALYQILGSEFMITTAPFITPTVFGNPELLLPDGIHPNQAGYDRIVTDYLFEPVRAALSARD